MSIAIDDIEEFWDKRSDYLEGLMKVLLKKLEDGTADDFDKNFLTTLHNEQFFGMLAISKLVAHLEEKGKS